MRSDVVSDLGPYLNAASLLVIGAFLVGTLAVALVLWVAYSVIWHAVRRGMREFHELGLQPAWVSYLHAPVAKAPAAAPKPEPEPKGGWALSSSRADEG
jgi:type II secretory pathway component PulM